ncbi:hypothetical protein [Kitasatospora camelliae]|uniref:Uncharacterized protein n=1 Tax=Kitasatospora camelliae TaxID=3156397 RepID=A0AAU8JNR5_9ACTN
MTELPAPGRDTTVPRPVIDPGLPARDRTRIDRILTGYPHLFAHPADAEPPRYTSGVAVGSLPGVVATAGAGGVAALLPGLVDQAGPSGPTGPTGLMGSVGEAVLRAVEWAGGAGPFVLAGAGAYVAGILAVRYGRSRAANRTLAQARAHCVHPAALTPEAAGLLARAQRAIATVTASRTHRSDLAGLRPYDDLHLPAEEWEIARTLQAHSRLSAGPADPGPVPAEEQRALDEVLAGTERRVRALESYAHRVAATDRATITAEPPDGEPSPRREQLLHLLARTAADDLAAAETLALADRLPPPDPAGP